MDISLRDLRPKLTAMIEQVKAGQKIEITERGKVVALLVPPIEAIGPGKGSKPQNEKKPVVVVKTPQQARDELLRRINKG